MRNYYSSFINKYNINNESCKSYNNETLAIINPNHFRTGILMLVLFLIKKENIVIFGDSIPKGMNRKILGQKLCNAKVFYRFFPGATSRYFFHYIKPTLQDPQTDFHVTVLHMGLNDILNLGSFAETVSNSIFHNADQCKNHGVKGVSISSVACTTLLNFDIIMMCTMLYEINDKHLVITLLIVTTSQRQNFGKTAYT